MLSSEKERVELTKNLKARGNVEDWLTEVQKSMVVSLNRVMKEGLADYQRRPRKEWVKMHAAQVVATVAQIMWSRESEEALRDPSNPLQKVSDWYDKNVDQLKDLTALVRSDLSKLERATIVALVTTDVHARDIIEDLKNDAVTSPGSFKWQQQLRYYWLDDTVKVQQSNSWMPYGFEYMGATTRLVITPLTDRCFPEDDHEILTNYGFKTLRELETLWGADIAGPPADPRLYVAGYDRHSKEIVYERPLRLVVNKSSKQNLVEFTHSKYAGQWASSDDAFGMGREVGARPNYVSLQVTSDHEMWVRVGSVAPNGATHFKDPPGRGVDVPWEKRTAGGLADSLIANENCVKVLGRPASGVNVRSLYDAGFADRGFRASATAIPSAAGAGAGAGAALPSSSADLDGFFSSLGLTSRDQIKTFVELFGFWTGDGTLDHANRRIQFQQVKESDLEYLQKALASLPISWHSTGVEVKNHRVKLRDGFAAGKFLVDEPSWVDWFFEEYGVKYGPDAVLGIAADDANVLAAKGKLVHDAMAEGLYEKDVRLNDEDWDFLFSGNVFDSTTVDLVKRSDSASSTGEGEGEGAGAGAGAGTGVKCKRDELPATSRRSRRASRASSGCRAGRRSSPSSSRASFFKACAAPTARGQRT